MERNKEDFYIAMLRFGKKNLENGFRLSELIIHMQQQGYFIHSDSSTLMHHYFPLIFFSKNARDYPDNVSFFFLKPECYIQLLEYDNFIAGRKESFETRVIAIIAIILT